MTNFRVGSGFDTHKLGDDTKPLVVAGVEFDAPGPLSHSDGDVVVHACVDALLGPLNLGNIGTNYPNTDSKWEGANSLEILKDAMAKVTEVGWSAVNIDCTFVGERPKISLSEDQMSKILSDIVGAPVSIKGKTTEGSPAFSEFVTCYATALLSQNG